MLEERQQACRIEKEYGLRIAELQAKYRLVAADGPVTFFCDGSSKNESSRHSFKPIRRRC